MSNVHFISDPHFSHENMLEFRNEVHGMGFDTVYQMNEWIVDNINSVVAPRDTLWILGDVVMHAPEELYPLGQLNGTINIILGNHDPAANAFYPWVNNVYGLVKKYGAIMSHCPIHPAEMEFRGWSSNIHGHIHHKERLLDDSYINVNMDIIGPKPLPLEAIRERIKKNNEQQEG